jgi:hypothetical protein
MKKLSPSDLTLEEAQAIESELDVPWMEVASLKSIGYVKAILVALLSRDRPREVAEVEAAGATVGEVKSAISPDELPDYYEDGMPKAGGRSLDSYIVAFGLPPYCWPPTVTRKQTFRDLHLLNDAAQSVNHG